MKKPSLLLIVLSIFSLQGYGQEVVAPDLRAFIEKSFAYFPKVKELEQQVEVSQLREDVVRGAYRPTATANLTYSYLDPVSIIKIPTGPGTYNEFQTQPYSNQNANIAVNQVLYDFGKSRHLIEKATYDIQIAQDNLEASKITLASQVSANYFSILYLQQTLVVQDSVIAYFSQYKKLIDKRILRGDALEFDALTAQSNIDQATNRKVELQNLLQRQYILLAYATGESQPKISNNQFLDFPLGAVPEDSLMNVARVGNRDLAISRLRVMAQQEELAISRKNFLPTFNLNGGLGFRNGYQPDILQTRFNYVVGAGLSIPLYTGKRNQNQLKIAEKNLQSTKYAAMNTESGIKRDIDQALADIEASSDRLQNIGSQIRQASRGLELAKSRFKNGTLTYVELLNSQTNLQQVHLSKLQYAYQLTLAKVELARLLGIEYWKKGK